MPSRSVSHDQVITRAQELPRLVHTMALAVEDGIFHEARSQSIPYEMSSDTHSVYFFAGIGSALVRAKEVQRLTPVVHRVDMRSICDAVDAGRQDLAGRRIVELGGRRIELYERRFAQMLTKDEFWSKFELFQNFLDANRTEPPTSPWFLPGYFVWMFLAQVMKKRLPNSFQEFVVTRSGVALTSAFDSYWEASDVG